jgi:hypothetical protein
MWNVASAAVVRMLQADVCTLATNSRLIGHSVPEYMDSSIQPKDENWFLRMCCNIVIGLYESVLHGQLCSGQQN